MVPFSGHSIYQAERAQSEREQRLADARAGEFAADLSRFCALLVRPAHALRGLSRLIFREIASMKRSSRALSAPER